MRSLGRTAALLACALLAMGASECGPHRYQIELRPDGAGYERSFVRGVDAPAATAGFYGEPVEAEKTLRYTGRFAGATPAELGGGGDLAYFDSPLGSASLYLERFGGPERVSTRVIELVQELERLVQDLEAWIEVEVGPGERSARLGAFVRTELIPDLFELTMLDLQHGATEESLLRQFQYVVERGYLDLRELAEPNLGRSRWSRMMGAIERKWRRRSPDGAGLPAFLETEEAARASLLRVWPELPSVRARGATAAPDATPTPVGTATQTPALSFADWSRPAFPRVHDFVRTSFVVNLTGPDLDLSARGRELRLSLVLGSAPLETNGEWDATTGRVVWTQLLEPSGMLAFATWSQPDREAQRRHLGTVRLEGQSLASHAMAFAGLDADDRSAWTRFVDDLAPGPGLAERLRSFVLPSEVDSSDRERTEELTGPLLQAYDDGDGVDE